MIFQNLSIQYHLRSYTLGEANLSNKDNYTKQMY